MHRSIAHNKLIQAVGLGIFVIVAANVLFFVVANIMHICGVDSNTIGVAVSLPAWPWTHPAHLYGLLTYMFAQVNVLHLAYNMLWLWCFAGILRGHGVSCGYAAVVYLVGGVVGGLSYLLAGATGVVPRNGMLLGSSAAVLAVAAAAGMRFGAYKMSVFPLGHIAVRWIAAGMIAITLIASSPMQLFPHVAGLIAGVLSVFAHKYYVRRKSAAKPMTSRLSDDEQSEFDALLAQVSDSGFNALSHESQQRLFALSKRINNSRSK